MLDIFDDREHIRRAKARYCRFVDTQQWKQLSDLLEPGFEMQMFDTAGVAAFSFGDRESYISFVAPFLEGGHSIHQVHNEEFDRVSPTEIDVIWSLEDVIVFPEPHGDQPARWHGYGHLHERWRLGPDGWRLARMELRRTILDVTPA